MSHASLLLFLSILKFFSQLQILDTFLPLLIGSESVDWKTLFKGSKFAFIWNFWLELFAYFLLKFTDPLLKNMALIQFLEGQNLFLFYPRFCNNAEVIVGVTFWVLMLTFFHRFLFHF